MFDKEMALKIFIIIISCKYWQNLNIDGIIFAIDLCMKREGFLKSCDQIYLFSAVQYAQTNGIEDALKEYFGDD